MGELFLYKFGTSTLPHQELFDIAETENLDPWFEYMKRIQQYPEEDLGTLRGSFLVDWSRRPEIAGYFANDQRNSDSEGTLWIADVTAMGAILHQDIRVQELSRRFQNALLEDKPMGLPLVFCPRRQITCLRARNKDAIYIAQMDLRCDLAETWKMLEHAQQGEEIVLLKLILPKGSIEDCAEWLRVKGINKAFIYPDQDNYCPVQAHR